MKKLALLLLPILASGCVCQRGYRVDGTVVVRCEPITCAQGAPTP